MLHRPFTRKPWQSTCKRRYKIQSLNNCFLQQTLSKIRKEKLTKMEWAKDILIQQDVFYKLSEQACEATQAGLDSFTVQLSEAIGLISPPHPPFLVNIKDQIGNYVKEFCRNNGFSYEVVDGQYLVHLLVN